MSLFLLKTKLGFCSDTKVPLFTLYFFLMSSLRNYQMLGYTELVFAKDWSFTSISMNLGTLRWYVFLKFYCLNCLHSYSIISNPFFHLILLCLNAQNVISSFIHSRDDGQYCFSKNHVSHSDSDCACSWFARTWT